MDKALEVFRKFVNHIACLLIWSRIRPISKSAFRGRRYSLCVHMFDIFLMDGVNFQFLSLHFFQEKRWELPIGKFVRSKIVSELIYPVNVSLVYHLLPNSIGFSALINSFNPRALICFNLIKLYGIPLVSTHLNATVNQSCHCKPSKLKLQLFLLFNDWKI